MASEELEAKLAEYLAGRDRQRVEQIAKTLVAMTSRERALFREAAVMGFVRGQMAVRAGVLRPPGDAQIFMEVVACCHGFPDLYPTVHALTAPPSGPDDDC